MCFVQFVARQFIVKNLMKPLFCVPPLDDGSWADVPETLVVSAQKEVFCWSDRHLAYCTVSLFGLCLFLPSATLTSAVKFSDGEDIRYVSLQKHDGVYRGATFLLRSHFLGTVHVGVPVPED